MEAVEYMKKNNETTRSLHNLSLSLSRLSNDIKHTVMHSKASTVSFKDDPIEAVPSYNRLKETGNSKSCLNDTGYSSMSLRHSLSRTPSSMRSSQQSLHNDIDFQRYSNNALHQSQSRMPSSMRSSKQNFHNNTDTQYSNMSLHHSLSRSPSSLRNSQHVLNNCSDFQYRPSFQNINNLHSEIYKRGINSDYEPVLTQEELDAQRYFPVTMGTSYSITLPTHSTEEPHSSGILKRKHNANRSRSRFQMDDNYRSEWYQNKDLVGDLHAMIQRAPELVSAVVPELSPYEEYLSSLRLKRLQIEEDRLKQLKRQEELENLRGPEPKWYEKKDQTFHYEAHKNTQLVKSQDKWTDLLKQREDLLDSSNKMNVLYSTTSVF